MRTAEQLIAYVALCALSACNRAPIFDPPKLVQMSCLPDKSHDGMVLVFDTARKQVNWSNAGAVVQGPFTTTPMEYRFALAPTATTQAVQGVVNRFDGRFYPIWGAARRKSMPGDVAAGADVRVWRCKKQKSGALL